MTLLNTINFLLEIMKIIIISNYIVGRGFLGLVMSIEKPKFQLKFKETTILHPKK
jgi:hypothetical protein